MLRTAIICPDRELSIELQRALGEIGRASMLRTIDRYPTGIELTRFVRAHGPQVVFVSIESLPKMAGIIDVLADSSPGAQVIAIHRSYDPQLLLEVMRAGIREFVALPFDRTILAGALDRVKELLDRKPVLFDATEHVYSFLPSKAGVGTSTIALNTAVALSRLPNTQTLLSDFDLNSGIVRFMLKLDNPYCVVDAAERSIDIDESFWSQIVTRVGNLDVLHAGKLNPNFRMEPAQVRSLVDFARRTYKVMFFDLSGNLEKYSLELMQESKRVFLVCTPEIPSLHLAREKYQYLQTMDLGDRVSVLLNRCHKKNVLSPAQIEELLGLRVQLTFPNDYVGVNRAMADGRAVESGSELGKQCAALAAVMVEHKPAPQSDRKRFIEFFSITPPRYSFESRKTGL